MYCYVNLFHEINFIIIIIRVADPRGLPRYLERLLPLPRNWKSARLVWVSQIFWIL